MQTRTFLAVALLSSTVASAQPGLAPPLAEPGVPPPYAYQPPPGLTLEDQQLLAHGEMSTGTIVAGGAMAWLVGFGTGQLVEGRWSEIGYVFTVGEAAAVGTMIYGLSQVVANEGTGSSGNNWGAPLLIGGLVTYCGLHLWEILDAVIVPSQRNTRVRSLRARLGAPSGVGLSLRF